MAGNTSGGTLGLSDDHIKLLIACFRFGDTKLDQDKIAEAVGTTKKNLSVRLTRMKQRIEQVDLKCENKERSTPATPKTPRSTAKTTSPDKKRKNAYFDGDEEGEAAGSPKKARKKTAAEAKREVESLFEALDGPDGGVEVKDEDFV